MKPPVQTARRQMSMGHSWHAPPARSMKIGSRRSSKASEPLRIPRSMLDFSSDSEDSHDARVLRGCLGDEDNDRDMGKKARKRLERRRDRILEMNSLRGSEAVMRYSARKLKRKERKMGKAQSGHDSDMTLTDAMGNTVIDNDMPLEDIADDHTTNEQLGCALCGRTHDGRSEVAFCQIWFHARCIGVKRGHSCPEDFICEPCREADRLVKGCENEEASPSKSHRTISRKKKKPMEASNVGKRFGRHSSALSTHPSLPTVPEDSEALMPALYPTLSKEDNSIEEICPVCDSECTCDLTEQNKRRGMRVARRSQKHSVREYDSDDAAYDDLANISESTEPDNDDDEDFLAEEEVYLKSAVVDSESMHELDDEEDTADGHLVNGRLDVDSSEDDSVVHRMWCNSESDNETESKTKQDDGDVVYYVGKGWSTDSGDEDAEETESYFDTLLERTRPVAINGSNPTYSKIEARRNRKDDASDALVVTGLVLVRASSPVLTKKELSAPKDDNATLSANSRVNVTPAKSAKGVGSITTAQTPSTPIFSSSTASLLGLSNVSGLPVLPNSSFYKPLSSVGSLTKLEVRKRKSSLTSTLPLRNVAPLEGKRTKLSDPSACGMSTPTRIMKAVPMAASKTQKSAFLDPQRSRSENNTWDFRIEDLIVVSEDEDDVQSAPEDTTCTSPTAQDVGSMFSLPGTPTMVERTRLTAGNMTVSSMLTRWDRIPIGAFRKSTRRRNSVPNFRPSSHVIRSDAMLVSSTNVKRVGSTYSPSVESSAVGSLIFDFAEVVQAGSGSTTSTASSEVLGLHHSHRATSELPSAVASPLVLSPLFKNDILAAGLPASMYLGEAAMLDTDKK